MNTRGNPLVGLAVLALLFVCVTVSNASPSIVFSPTSLTITPDSTMTTPHLVVQNATGITSVNIQITVPAGLSVDTTNVGGSMACLTKGYSAGNLFFAEWNAATRQISVACNVTSGATIEILQSITFTTGHTVTAGQFTVTGTVTGASSSPTFVALSLELQHTVAFTSVPSVDAQTVFSGDSVHCSAAASDTVTGHSVAYSWSDGGKGGSFSPNATTQNPTYTAPINSSGVNVAVTLSCTASCTAASTVKATGSTTLTVSSTLKGDVDGDRDVDRTDADLVLQAVIGDISVNMATMDVNGNGKVTSADATWILKHPVAAGS
ncbi:MAG: dockerin type I domain-containing protein [Armatimonadota bacterium]|nr:dockerin type I repeat-containing protein [bacterium]